VAAVDASSESRDVARERLGLKKKVVKSGVPETGGPFNLGVTYGPLLFVSGLPPFREDYARQMRATRERGEKPPPYVPEPFDDQVRVVMDHVKAVVEAAGSNMDCLLKVIVWLKDQTKAESFDRSPYYFNHRDPAGPYCMQAGRTPMDCELEVEAIGTSLARPGARRCGRSPPRKRGRGSRRSAKRVVRPGAAGCPSTLPGLLGRRAIGAPPGARPVPEADPALRQVVR
jgi:2-iminobutanoate/2-iminopropanoate deaminase